MEHYYFNKNTDKNNKHEVHTEGCSYKPDLQNRTYIGYCSDCKEAIARAEKEYPNEKFDGCYYCCNKCHTG